MISHRFRIAVTVICSIAAVSFSISCGGKPSKQTRAPDIDPAAKDEKTIAACALLSEMEMAGIVGNPVNKGRVFTSADICKRDTEDPKHVDVLLTFRTLGSIREQVLCDDLRKAREKERIEGLGEIAVWQFSTEGRYLAPAIWTSAARRVT